jgi:hypothetical protein
MSRKEREGRESPERPQDQIIRLRPHHAFDPTIREAITGEQSPDVSGRTNLDTILENIIYWRDFAAYRRDTFTGQGDKEARKATLLKVWHEHQAFIAQLQQLPDDAIVHLDLHKDAICDACPIGRHCVATNAISKGGSIDAPLTERRILYDIYKLLVANGFTRGTDFTSHMSQHVFQDYDGQNMWRGNQSTPVTIDFLSMYVRMGALRVALRRG